MVDPYPRTTRRSPGKLDRPRLVVGLRRVRGQRSEDGQMQFPKRPEEHIRETRSFKLLNAAIPDSWLLREVTERDYGVDAYVEIVTGHVLSGELCSLQLKGTKNITWASDGTFKFSSVRVQTVNYWMALPVPVFLVLTDEEAHRAFFCPVKDYVRRNYEDFQTQRSLGFQFKDCNVLGTEQGLREFLKAYKREDTFSDFHLNLRSLVTFPHEYFGVLLDHIGRDWHMAVDADEELRFVHVYQLLRAVSDGLGREWGIENLQTVFSDTRDNPKNKSGMVLELSLEYLASELIPVFIEILAEAARLVSQEHQHYWLHNDILLLTVCTNLRLDSYREQAKWLP